MSTLPESTPSLDNIAKSPLFARVLAPDCIVTNPPSAELDAPAEIRIAPAEYAPSPEIKASSPLVDPPDPEPSNKLPDELLLEVPDSITIDPDDSLAFPDLIVNTEVSADVESPPLMVMLPAVTGDEPLLSSNSPPEYTDSPTEIEIDPENIEEPDDIEMEPALPEVDTPEPKIIFPLDPETDAPEIIETSPVSVVDVASPVLSAIVPLVSKAEFPVTILT